MVLCLRYSLLQLLLLHMLLLLLLVLNMGLLMLLLLLHHGRLSASLNYFGKGCHCHGSSYSGSLAIATNDKNGITYSKRIAYGYRQYVDVQV